ncbi:MAG: hypothetical protein ACE14V_04465 [bacterium]
MNPIKKYIISCLPIVFCLGSLGFTENQTIDANTTEPAVSYGAEVDFTSRYIWRGMPFSEGAVMQTSVWVSAADFTLTLWNNFVLHHEPNHGQVNEFDLTLGYGKEWDNISIEPSLNYYWYPNQEEAPSTGECIVKIAYTINELELYTTHNIDIKEYPGAYFGDVGLGYSHDLNPNLTFDGQISLGWGSSKFNDTYIGISKSALNVAQCDFAVTFHLENGIYFRPHIALSTILDHELREQFDDSTMVYGGMAIGKEF